jgi:hypothetical protein
VRPAPVAKTIMFVLGAALFFQANGPGTLIDARYPV